MRTSIACFRPSALTGSVVLVAGLRSTQVHAAGLLGGQINGGATGGLGGTLSRPQPVTGAFGGQVNAMGGTTVGGSPSRGTMHTARDVASGVKERATGKAAEAKSAAQAAAGRTVEDAKRAEDGMTSGARDQAQDVPGGMRAVSGASTRSPGVMIGVTAAAAAGSTSRGASGNAAAETTLDRSMATPGMQATAAGIGVSGTGTAEAGGPRSLAGPTLDQGSADADTVIRTPASPVNAAGSARREASDGSRSASVNASAESSVDRKTGAPVPTARGSSR